MKANSLTRCFFWIIFGGGLFIGMGLRVIWGYGGPPWTYNLGDIIMGITIVFVGISLLVALKTNPRIIYELRTRKKYQRNVNKLERLAWYVFGSILTIFGLIILIIAVTGWMIGCLGLDC
jgi:hypothetical protein